MNQPACPSSQIAMTCTVLVLQPMQSQAALASRTVSWNPVNFSQALSEAESQAAGKSKSDTDGGRNSDAGRNSQADYAPGQSSQSCVL